MPIRPRRCSCAATRLPLALPQLAIVGSRNASAGGAETAHAFAAHLAGCGLAITSGLALGIDAAAHAGAIAGGGRTIAVLRHRPRPGLPATQCEPRRGHRRQRRAVLGVRRRACRCCARTFPRRNRIISGLAVGTLVVEAGLQSGALITARRAIEQGREVFAIPGSIHNPLAKGCHRLIREGAKLVESADHILEELAALLASAPTRRQQPSQAAPDARSTRDHGARSRSTRGCSMRLAGTPWTWTRWWLRSGLTPAEVSSMLLILELEGSVQPLAGRRYQRQR